MLMVFVLYRETEVLLGYNDDSTTITEIEDVFDTLENARAYVRQYEGREVQWGQFAPNIVALRTRPLPSWSTTSHLPDIQSWVIEERPIRNSNNSNKAVPLERIA